MATKTEARQDEDLTAPGKTEIPTAKVTVQEANIIKPGKKTEQDRFLQHTWITLIQLKTVNYYGF